MHRLVLTFSLAPRVLFLLVSSVIIENSYSALQRECAYNSYDASGCGVEASPFTEIQNPQSLPTVASALSTVEWLDFLRRAVTPSLLVIIVYVLVVQYLVPWVDSLRHESQMDSCQYARTSSDRSETETTREKTRSSSSRIDDSSTHSSSKINSPVVNGGVNMRHPSLIKFSSSEAEFEDHQNSNNQKLQAAEGKTPQQRHEHSAPAKKKKTKKQHQSSTNEESNQINQIGENVLIRDQWLALVDSTNVTLNQLLIQLESGKSATLKGIREFVTTGRVAALRSIIHLVIQERRPVEAAGLLRLVALDSDAHLQEERERLAGLIAIQLVNETRDTASSSAQASLASYGLNLLFNQKILNSKAPPLTSGIIHLILNNLVTRKTDASTSEIFQTLKSLIPIPYSPDVSQRMFEIAVHQPASVAIEIAEATLWDSVDGAATIRRLCEAWRESAEAEKPRLLSVLRLVQGKRFDWFDNECPEDVKSALATTRLKEEKKNEIDGTVCAESTSLDSAPKIDGLRDTAGKSEESNGTPWRIRPRNCVSSEDDLKSLFDCPEKCVDIISRCEKRSDRNLALTIVQAFEEKEEINRDETRKSVSIELRALRGLLKVFTDHQDITNAVRLVSLLEKVKAVDAQCFALVMQLCCRAGDLAKAEEMIKKIIPCCSPNEAGETQAFNRPPYWMLTSDAMPSIVSCISKALRIYTYTLIDSKQSEKALDFIVSIGTGDSVKIDSVTITYIFLKLFKNQPSRSLVDRLLSISLDGIDMKNGKTRNAKALQNRIRIDENFLTVMVDCCVKFRSDEFLAPIIERYRNEWHTRFTPDVQACGLLIKTLGSCGRIDDCRWIFWHVTETQGVEPSEVTYGCMLDALVNNGKVDEAVVLFENMKAKGSVRPNTIMYSTIVKGYAQEKKLDKALTMHEEMKSKNIPINTVTYNTLVDSCARVGAMDKAAGLLDDMLSSGVEPDLITFSTIAKGYCVQGDVERAMQLLSSMKDRDIRPDGILYNSLLDGCVRASRPDLCEQLWQQMKKSGIPPSNFTLTILIKMFGRAGKLTRAFEAVRELPRRYGFSINAHVYTCLMSACIANNEFSKALNVFECMQKDDICADAKTYETVLFGVTRWGNFTEALKIVRDAFNLNFQNKTDKTDVDNNPHRRRSYVNGRMRIVGFHMNVRNFKKLWNVMKEAGEFEFAVPLIEELIATYDSAIHRYLPPEFIRPYPHPYGYGLKPNQYR